MRIRLAFRTLALTTIAAGAVGGTFVSAASAASPADSALQRQVDTQVRDYPGGIQTAPNEVTYKDGAVTVTFPASSRAGVAANPCAAGAYCFYDGKDFTGRKLTFRDCGGNQSLTDYGFGNKTSSWQNTTSHTIEVYDKDVSPFVTLWREAPNSAASVVSAATYNKADFFHTYCG